MQFFWSLNKRGKKNATSYKFMHNMFSQQVGFLFDFLSVIMKMTLHSCGDGKMSFQPESSHEMEQLHGKCEKFWHPSC